MDDFFYKKLEVYHLSKSLVVDVYRFCRTFPLNERNILCNQIQRAVISVPSNIAEGMGRMSNRERIHFIEIAYGSLMEVETQIDIACDLHYVSPDSISEILELIDREARLLSGLRSRRLKPHNP